MEKTFIINGTEVKVQNYSVKGDEVSFSLEGKDYRYALVSRKGTELVLDRGGRFTAAVGAPNRDGDSMVIANGREAVLSQAGKKTKKAGVHAGGLTSPMPGKIFKVIKAEGTSVKKGETILILEAMKMEHSIRSDKDGVVKKINYREGELVQGGVVLVELE
jgi:3-methylcrotonyl-CoA carboxylase alpha subunit